MKIKQLLSLALAFLLVLACVPMAVNAADGIAIDETNFPDANFRAYILEQSYGADGVLTQGEIAGITVIHVANRGIADLTGIEYFTALEWLYCNGNQLTSLDVSKNTALEELYCFGNQLTSLDVSKNTAMEQLECAGNQLTSLDVSKNTALWYLDCGDNQLTSLDVSKNTALWGFLCNGNQLTSLDVSKNTVLEVLYCFGNQLTSLDVSKNTAMEQLECAGNQLTSLDVSNNTALEFLDCGDNQLTSLDVSKNTALGSLHCYENQLISLDVSRCAALGVLSCSGNQLISLDVSKNTALMSLYCDSNQLTSLDVSGCAALERLDCDNNQLTTLDVSRNTALRIFNCGHNQLTSLDMSGCAALEEFNCYDNQLTSLDVSGRAALWDLDCGDNQLTSLDVSRCTALEQLYCYYNQLTSLDVSGCTALEGLYCEVNQLTRLGVSGCPALEQLSCGDNQLTSLDVSGCAALEQLYCYDNQLTRLDVSGCAALWDLACAGNQLTSLDVSGCTALVGLYCNGNQLTSLDVSNNSALTNLFCDDQTYYIELDENDRFELTQLPGGFDISKATAWTNGTVSGTVLTPDTNYNSVTYTYQAADDWTMEVTLVHAGYADRIYGKNRFETATQVANQLKESLEVDKFNAIILANGYNFADALSGSYLAAVKNAPILLTWNGDAKYDYLNEYTVDYVKANLNEGGTVYILGGASAVPETVDAMLEGYNVVRLAGENRFDTNLLILEEAGIGSKDILICTGTNFADSLSASAAGKPILLVYKDLTEDQLNFLRENFSNNSFVILGGESAVGTDVEMTLAENGYDFDRLAGANRFETSVLIAERFFEAPESAVLAYAWDFPDGLCGGALAYAMDAPLILTMTKYESQAAEYIQRQGIKSGIVLGGEGLISEGSVQLIFGIIGEE